MDLYNNEVGRTIALSSPNASNEDLINLVTAALLNGEAAVWDGKNMTYSNHCPECSIP